ncbi:unnamed protein product, partial [Heterosigma akashiwo]
SPPKCHRPTRRCPRCSRRSDQSRQRPRQSVQDPDINVTGVNRRQHAAKSFAGSLGVIAAEAVLVVVVA